MAATQKAPLASTFGDTVSEPAWKHKPCWYQVSSQDHMIAPENQVWMSGRMNPKRFSHWMLATPLSPLIPPKSPS
jgi:hypothetical protein